ncbi:MAG: hypothetical protein JSR36_17450 [Proteobacteria bacterium]|nr:hypothetical protein [Pseudomonadota bacterium]
MRRRLAVVVAAVTAGPLFLSSAHAQDAATAAQLQTLKEQVQQLQKQIDQMQQQQSHPPAAQTAVAATATPPVVVEKKGSPALHAGPVTLTFGGFMELGTIYRNRNETADMGSNWNTAIPYPNSSNYGLDEFRMSARQSRLSLLAQGPESGSNRAEGYLEFDFLGAAPTANSNESNSYTPRLRHVYGLYTRSDVGFSLLAGQTWSMATMFKSGLKVRSEAIPLTIDAQYVPGFNWTRDPQIRLVERFNDVVSAGLSFESPQALIFNGPNPLPPGTVFNNPGGSLYYSGQNYSLDPAPDIIGKVAIDPGFGHYEVYGMVRWFRDQVAGHNDTQNGEGVGAGMILPLVHDVLDFRASGLFGNGIGRYGSAQLPDVTLKPDGHFATIRGYHVLAGLEAHPAPAWTAYLYFGEEHADSQAYTDAGGLGYGYGSPLYDNSGCETLGGKCAANTKSIMQGTGGVWWKYYQGEIGNLQMGLQYSYTKREIFPGVGGDPDTNISVAMFSLRYYPYQR